MSKYIILVFSVLLIGCIDMIIRQKGKLYITEEGKSRYICDGVLESHTTHNDNMFVCSDGRNIYNLTNFTFVKAVE